MKKFCLYLLCSSIFFSISYSKENLENQAIKEQIKIEQLIEEIKELKEENKKLKEEVENKIEKYKSEVDKKLEETKEITKDNLEFYDKSMTSIKEQSDRVIAQSDKFTNIVLELLGALGLVSVFFKAYDRKKLMKE